MKIEANTTPNILPVNKPASPRATTKSESVKKVKPEKLNADSMRNKMAQWFAKAGIMPVSGLTLETDTNARVARHQHVKAQRKLNNLERILGLAMDFSLEQGKAENLDADWFFSFIDMAEEINSPGMQELWGKIFAVEISRPGTFSLRTLQTLKKLTQKDAQVFKIAVNLASRKKGEYSPKLIFGYHQKPGVLSLFGLIKDHHLSLAEYGLAYPDLLSLMDLNLIYSSEIESGELKTDARSQWRVGNQIVHLSPLRRGLTLNYYKFTATGAELFKLVSGQPNIQYLEALKTTLSSGFEVT